MTDLPHTRSKSDRRRRQQLPGVALAEDANGDRIVLASDQDFGLFIFRYNRG